jgi:hypothetical protein
MTTKAMQHKKTTHKKCEISPTKTSTLSTKQQQQKQRSS